MNFSFNPPRLFELSPKHTVGVALRWSNTCSNYCTSNEYWVDLLLTNITNRLERINSSTQLLVVRIAYKL